MRHALEVFDDRGALTELTSRQAEIAAIVTLMDTLDGAQLHQALVSFASGLQGSWGYYQGVEQVYQQYITRYPRAVVQALACGWQVERQATNNKAYGTRKRLAQDAQCSFSSAATLLPEAAEAIRKEWLEALETAVRSASLIEHVTAALRPLLETCRGQVDQQILDLFASVHNHRRFVRGKRAGKAPIEILTGKEMEKTWVISL